MDIFAENPYMIAGAVTTLSIGMQKTFAGFSWAERKATWRDAFTALVIGFVTIAAGFQLYPQFMFKDNNMAQYVLGSLGGVPAGMLLALAAEVLVASAKKVFGL